MRGLIDSVRRISFVTFRSIPLELVSPKARNGFALILTCRIIVCFFKRSSITVPHCSSEILPLRSLRIFRISAIFIRYGDTIGVDETEKNREKERKRSKKREKVAENERKRGKGRERRKE